MMRVMEVMEVMREFGWVLPNRLTHDSLLMTAISPVASHLSHLRKRERRR